MFILAILIGILGYSVFLLGVLGSLSFSSIATITVMLFSIGAYLAYGNRQEIGRKSVTFYKNGSKFFYLLFGLFIIQVLINIVGVLGPELAFDALWYHLTFPKLYIESGEITHIPGGIFYYSTMPKFTELLYIVALLFQGEIAAKFIHFMFGIGTCIVLYQVSRLYVQKQYAFLAVVIFYSSLVVSWESTTAYVDLARSFFELLAVYALLLYTEKQESDYLMLTGVMLGLAISTKLLAIGSVLLVCCILVLFLRRKRTPIRIIVKKVGIVGMYAMIIPLPWFIMGSVETGNPVYPFFSGMYDTGISLQLLNPLVFIHDLGTVFLQAADPINPFFLIIVPLLVLGYKNFPLKIKLLCWYSFLSLLVWYVTPRTGGGRFILPYIAVYAIVSSYCLYVLSRSKYVALAKYGVVLIILFAVTTIGYRGIAVKRYIPVIIGNESKHTFLSRELNFSFGDFYDTDGYFAKTVKPGEIVLLYGFHNLYYANFRFIHESSIKPGDIFHYIAVQNASLPERFRDYHLLHSNTVTGVSVYAVKGNYEKF